MRSDINYKEASIGVTKLEGKWENIIILGFI